MNRLIVRICLFVMPAFVGLYLLASQESAANVSMSIKESTIEAVPIKWVEERLSTMTLKEKIGQFFMVAAYSGKPESHLLHIDSLVSKYQIGGIIFFQGDRQNLKSAIDRFQGKAKYPLLIGMDAEWGTQMRLKGEARFPYNYTIGAANDTSLTKRLAEMMAQECVNLGIHLNFAPVADVNSNPKNPVIGFRSYGENPVAVGRHVRACVEGMEECGVLTSIKHFPGHGDTDVDSHLELPIVNNSYAHISAVDFSPFRAGIKAGASTVMIGHLNIPALDPSGTPSSLSKLTIQKYLKDELGFEGLVVSDALGMKAVSKKYGKTEVVVKAFEAGCDILLFPESIVESIKAIESKVKDGKISIEEINRRCRKVLVAKHKSIIEPLRKKEYSKIEVEIAKKTLYEKAITVIKNEDDFLPIKSLDKNILHVGIGGESDELSKSLNQTTRVKYMHFSNAADAINKMNTISEKFDIIITSLHASSVLPKNDYGMPYGWRKWVQQLPENSKNIVTLFGNPYVLTEEINLSNVHTLIVGYEDHSLVQERVGQLIMGTTSSSGRLPITLNPKFKRGLGIPIASLGRLKNSWPEEMGVSAKKLSEIDDIALKSIEAGAFPGCQIVVAVKGNVIYRKSFGHHTYTKEREVKNDDLYDIASITKIAASTLSLMKLNSNGEFSLDSTLSSYLPDLTKGTPYANIRLKSMMAHQAGLKNWIPFYVATLANNRPSPNYYSNTPNSEFSNHVADDLFMKGDYSDALYQRILREPLNSRTYKYSDVGYYFVKKIVEKKSSKSLDKYVLDEFYKPMGLSYLRYNPLDYFPLDMITPTENDTIFRKQLIHGYVHDQGAAMLGGVGGHAGLFSNASDLAALMQMFLNKGEYGGVQYLDPSIVEQYTGCQFCPKNRRGAGFDKPTVNRQGGPTCDLVSLSSFGHSGFTGTLVWADPIHDINYVFLSNRVHPNAENWKIIKMNIRTDIQRVIYNALGISK